MGDEADSHLTRDPGKRDKRNAPWVPNLGKWMKEEGKSISSLNKVRKLGIVRF